MVAKDHGRVGGWTVELLNRIAQLANCVYLSDLHYVTITQQQRPLILSLSERSYSLRDYQEALDYICGHDRPPAHDIPEAKRILLAELMRTGRRVGL